MAYNAVIINVNGVDTVYGAYDETEAAGEWDPGGAGENADYFPAIYSNDFYPAGTTGFFLGHWPDGAGGQYSAVKVNVGFIGGWDIDYLSIKKDSGAAATSGGMAPGDYPFYSGAEYADRATAPYRVTIAGVLYATGATISGTVTATDGVVGGFTVDSTEGLYAGADATRVQMKAGAGFWCGATAQAGAPFRVLANGALTATSATITGAVTATSGDFSGVDISGTLTITGAGKIYGIDGADWFDLSVANGLRFYNDGLGDYVVDIPADGSAPTWYSGVIKEVQLEIYTSGIIQTAADPSATGGCVITPSYIRGYNSDPLLLFEVVYNGADEGDFYVGDFANDNPGLFYDHSEGTFTVMGTLQTDVAGGQRMVISGANNNLIWYDSTPTEVVRIDDNISGLEIPGILISGAGGGLIRLIDSDLPNLYLNIRADRPLLTETRDSSITGSYLYKRYLNARHNVTNYAFSAFFDSNQEETVGYRSGIEARCNLSNGSASVDAIGIHGTATNAGSGAAWAGYFDDGDVYIKNSLWVDTGYIYGGDDASDALYLSSTSHATKGKIYFGANSAYDQANDYFGIGTSSPLNNLQVAGDMSIEVGKYYGFNTYYSGGFKRIGAGYAGYIKQESGDGRITFDVADTGAAASVISFTEAMTILKGGNVGIGTSSPDNLLDIATSSALDGLVITQATATPFGVKITNPGVDNDPQIGTFANNELIFVHNSVGKMWLTSTGLGIGTGSPQTELDIADGTISIDSSTSGDNLIYGENTAHSLNEFTFESRFDDVAIQAGVNDGNKRSVRIYAGDTLTAIFASSGNVGIGTTSPGYLLEVNGTTGITGNVTIGGDILVSGDADTYINPLTDGWEFHGGGIDVFEAQEVGGKSILRTYNITTSGSAANVYISGIGGENVFARSTSSARYKANIRNLEIDTYGLYYLKGPRTFESLVDLDYKGDMITYHGLVAEEVAEVFPAMVHYDEGGLPDSVMESRLALLMIPEIQSHEWEIRALYDRIAYLEEQIEILGGKQVAQA